MPTDHREPSAPPGPIPPPRLIFWELTRRCNLNCRHCRAVPAHEAVPDELALDECRRILDQIAEVGKPLLILTGGEPLLRRDLFEIAEAARARGFPLALATNGTLIDEPLARRIAAAGFRRVAVSLDGARAATHDAFRGLAGSFDRALAGLRALRAAGLPVQVNVTLARHNAGELPALLDLAEREGAVAAHLFMLVPVGCGVELAETELLDPARYEELLNWLYDESRRRPLEIRATCAPHYYRIVRERAAAEPLPADGPNAAQRQARGCLAGTGACFISHRGVVQGCGYLPLAAGSLRERSFREIWEQSALFRELRDPDRLHGKCGVCGFRFVCSGCRARAFAATGDALAEEPFCAYVPPQPPGGARAGGEEAAP